MNHRPEKLILFFLKMGLRLPFFSFFATLVFSSLVFAMNGKTTYQAKIVKPDGYPLEAPVVNFKFSVLDAAASCVLYSENYSNVDMRSTGGLISFALGNGIRDFPVSGATAVFANVFDNLITSMPCQTPGIYNPQPSDSRRVVMQFNDGTGWQTLPAMTINDVPYAMYAGKANEAKALNGKADTAFVEYSTLANLNCNSVTEAITFNGVSFSCVPVGVASSGISSVTTSGSVLVTGGTASAPVISIQAATFSQDGYLTSLDYAEFKAKLSASATAIASTLGFAPVSGAAVASQIASSTLAGDVTGNPGSNTVSAVGGKSSAQISTSVDDTLAATASATASRIVKRDTSGNASFSGVSAVTANLNYVDIYKPTTSYNIRLQAPTSLSSNYILNLPSASGTTGQVLSTDGAGNLSWINPSTGSVVSVSATAPLASTGGLTPTLSIAQATSGTDGYLSATDWSTFNSKQQATSSAIIATLGYEPADVSSFAAGSVPFVNSNGALAEDNSQFFWDNSNKRLGIGITTPTARFHLASGSTSVAPLKITSGSLLVSPSDGSIEYDGTFLYYTDATNTRRTLSSTGGNNTYSGTNYFSGQTYISNTTNSVNSQTGALIVSGGIGVAGNIYSSGTIVTSANIQGSSITATSGVNTNVVQGNMNLLLNPNGGNVGIGASSPTYRLDVDGDARFNGANGIYATGSNSGLWFDTSRNNGLVNYGTNKIGFRTGNADHRFVIDGFGNVGIGITTPNSRLHVAGPIRKTGSDVIQTIHVADTGSNSNDGLTASTPVATLEAAFDIVNSYADQVMNIKLTGEVTFAANRRLANKVIHFQRQDNGITNWNATLSLLQSSLNFNLWSVTGSEEGFEGTIKLNASPAFRSLYGFNSISAGGFYRTTFEVGNNDRIFVARDTGSNGAAGGNEFHLFLNYRWSITNPSNFTGFKFDLSTGNNSTNLSKAYFHASSLPSFMELSKFAVWVSANGNETYYGNQYSILNGNLGIGIANPTARLHLASGTATANTAPLKFTSGTLMTSAQAGSLEYDGFNYYLTNSANVRRSIATVPAPGSFDNTNTISNSGGNITLSPNNSTGSVVVSAATASADSNTGALVVKGGAGISGNLNVSGAILTSANIQGASITATNGIVTPVINGTSNLALNPSGGNVGIGTTTPTALLEIKTATPVVNSTFAPLKLANPVGGLQDGGGSGVGISFAADIPKGIIFYERKGSFGRGDFHFLQNTTANASAAVLSESVMTIKNNGNVGIGITTPAALLHVSGTAENANRRIILENNGSTGNSVAEAVFKTGHSSELRVGADANGAFLYTPSTGTLRDFRIFTNATEKMRVTSEGVVGIGTANLSGGSGNTAIEGLLQVKGAASSTLFHAKGSGTEYAGFKLKVGPGNISGASDYYEFTMRPSVGAGVGTTADQSLIYFNNSYSRNFVDIALNPNGGRVGIGTSSPAYRLDVLASPSAGQPGSRINVNTNSWPLLLSNTNAASGAGFVIGQSNDDLYGRGFDTSNFAIFNASTTPTDVVMYNANTPTAGFLVLKASGNVGIGTSAPNAKLEVFDGDISQVTQNPLPHTWTKGRLSYRTFTGDYSFNTGIAKYLILWPRAVGATGTNGRLVDGTLKIRRGATHAFNSGTVGHLHASSGYNGTTGESYSYTATVGGGLLFYNVVYNGVDHVALGLPNSDYKWEFRGHYGIEEQSGYGPTFVYANSPGVGAVSALTTTYFATNALFVSSGNIGIGTSAPTEKLSVDGRAIFGPNAGWNESLVVGIDGSLAATGVQSATIGATNGNLHLEPKNGFDTYINHYTSGTRHVFIQTGNSSGRVGIGTTSPGYSLDVSGTLRVTGQAFTNTGNGSFSILSDIRYKDFHGKFDRGLDAVLNIDIIKFKYKNDNPLGSDSSHEYVGVSAQNLQQVIPEAVEPHKVGKEEYLTINTSPVLWTLINAIKQLYKLVAKRFEGLDRQIASIISLKADKAEIEVLKQKVAKFEAKSDKLEAENAALKSYLCRKDPAAPICK